MSTQTKSKLYLLVIGILLITNIAMLLFFLNKKEDNKKGNRGSNDRSAMMKEFLKNDIGFTPQQIQLYDTLSKQNKEKMKADFDAMKAAKEQQFKQLGSKGFTDSAINAIAGQAADNQKLIEAKTMNYFATVRKLCTAEQLPKFDSLFYKMWSKKKPTNEKNKF